MHPVLFKIGPITINTYGVFIAIGFLSGIFVANYFAQKEGLKKDIVYDFAFFILIWSIIGARLFYVIQYYHYYINHPLSILKIWQGGLVFYGGLIGGVLSVLYYTKKYNINKWLFGDIALVALPLGQFFGRLGCLSAGCCYGKPCNLPWAITFTNPESLAPHNIPLHPTEIYHALCNLIIFIFLFYFYKNNKRKFYGHIVVLYGMLYSVGRFIVEFYRGDNRGHIGPLSIPQFISIIVFIVSLITYFIRKKYYSFSKEVENERG